MIAAIDFGFSSSSFTKSAGFVSLAGKLHWFLYLRQSYFYDPSVYIYRWSSNFVEKSCWKGSGGGRDITACDLPCVFYCMEGKFEHISRNVMTLRTTTTKFRVSLY